MTTNRNVAHWVGPHLYVGGRREIVLGAEVHNSSASTESAIDRSFALVAELGATAVLAPVTWEQFEPAEGTFRVELIDAMLAAARKHGLALVPLWFGSWKNGSSSYAPRWVKLDRDRFVRCRNATGDEMLNLSPFCAQNWQADAAAFSRLMLHLREVDDGGTVLLVQVENEVGLHGASRDHSDVGESTWSQLVPQAVVDAVAVEPSVSVHDSWVRRERQRSGNWEQLFGRGADADEVFMATGYAMALEHIAAAGRAAFDVPLFTNAWLDNDRTNDFPGIPALAGGLTPGVYPSGGPVSGVAPVWRAIAGSLTALAPDIYFGDFAQTCHRYREINDRRLLIPETRRSSVGVANLFLAVGGHGASLIAPFGIDSLLPGEPEYDTLHDAYRLLTAFAELVARHPSAATTGFVLTDDEPTCRIEVGDVVLNVTREDPYGTFGSGASPGYGCAIVTGARELTVIGRGFHVDFTDDVGRGLHILDARELSADSALMITRQLNGDETSAGTMGKFPARGVGQSVVFPIPYYFDTTGVVAFELDR